MWVYKDNELQHHGVKGQKWGVRRYQTKSGKLTSAGKKRYLGSVFGKKKTEDPKAVAKGKASSSTKSVKDMSDDELKKAITRLQLEKQYRELTPQKVSLGKKLVNDAVIPAITEAGRGLIRDQLTKIGKKALGLNDKPNSDELVNELRKEIEKVKLSNEFKELTNPDSNTNFSKMVKRMKDEAAYKDLKSKGKTDIKDDEEDE